MAEVSAELKEKLLRFAAEVEKANIRIQQFYLFGSYASGKNHEWSDIDIAVVSEDFSGLRLNDYDKFIYAIMAVDRSIEAIPYRPEDFTPDQLMVKEILEHDVRII